jgi:hypothetical protein
MQFKEEWGAYNLMVLAAFRYCLGRRTYIVGTCVDWLMKYWEAFEENTRELILKEIVEAVSSGRAGDECDIKEWGRVLGFIVEPKDEMPTKNPWIDIRECLPPFIRRGISDEVIVYSPAIGARIGYRHMDKLKIMCDCCTDKDCPPTHWMQLPHPPTDRNQT